MTQSAALTRPSTPRDLKLGWIRAASFLAVVALLPLPWATNCDGATVTGLDGATDDPAQALIMLSTLALAAGLMLLARRQPDALPRALLQVLAASAAAQAFETVLMSMVLAPHWFAAGVGVVALIGLVVFDAGARAWLAGAAHWRALNDDPVARWPLLGALAVLLIGCGVGVGALVAPDNGTLAEAVVSGLLFLPGALALLAVPLVHRLLSVSDVAADATAVLTSATLPVRYRPAHALARPRAAVAPAGGGPGGRLGRAPAAAPGVARGARLRPTAPLSDDGDRA